MKSMIKQLRQRFLIAAFSSVFITLLVLIATINIINYRNVLKEADGTLTMLIENDGQFPSPEQMIGQKRPPMDMFNEETPFETRFFVVTLDENGQSVQTQTSQIAAIDQKAAESYGKQVFKESSDRGFIDSYRFHKVTEKTGTTVYFLDCHRSLINFYSFLRASLIVSAIGFFIVAVLLLFFSKKIMAPVIESYEKQKRFITDAGHELKTPLATIQADADVLSLQENNEWIDDIHVQVDKMSKLTNELIELAKMEEMDDRSAFVDFPISDIVSESAERFLTKARAQKKELTLDIEKGLVAH
ncbi:MAG: HAMP domain-containing histidine kinase, partial [Erysipelotrichaceae bacterium]|nr:HAMP domain-containing histidine kinase [Erysipelotrichaceae bacterium]